MSFLGTGAMNAKFHEAEVVLVGDLTNEMFLRSKERKPLPHTEEPFQRSVFRPTPRCLGRPYRRFGGKA